VKKVVEREGEPRELKGPFKFKHFLEIILE
jgi:hypothetical protein